MNKKVVILGGGESGTGAARLAQKNGLEVWLSDFGKIKSDFKQRLENSQIAYEEERHSWDKIKDASLIVKSPGIPKTAEILKKIEEEGIEIVSEIEFASRFTEKPIIAITGSNGKTTTTSLIAHMLEKAGLKVGLGGNIGHSFADLVVKDDFDYYVLEISSFQLDDIVHFAPHIAIILNITPDHLDEYDYDIMQYAKAKFKISQNQKAEDFLIWFEDDQILQKLTHEISFQATSIPFSLEKENETAYADDENIYIKYPDPFSMKVEDLALQGSHNTANSLAAAVNGNILKLRKQIIKDSLSDFEAVEHRMETVLTIHGMKFINDSKATNVNATYYALKSMKTPVVWIMGGKDKGNDYESLFPLIEQNVKAIVCLGAENSKPMSEFGKKVPVIVSTDNMKDAVRSAYMLGKPGDTVLLSPACASFDLFENYEQRGKMFKNEIKLL
ncbi:MAG: UDP-N-acetylmuramoyl-L-alanine--D-glutamate ligase [Weeksellaceae bacterium]|nr:UDP-N-acetylmuramoyl-L-alanine--D-glutamate ligase [Weeksellaceae bacterium]